MVAIGAYNSSNFTRKSDQCVDLSDHHLKKKILRIIVTSTIAGQHPSQFMVDTS